MLGVIDTGPTTNHVNFVTKPNGNFAYVTVGGENVVKVYRRNGGSPQLVATIPTGGQPHGIWPSPDNTRVYVALENGESIHTENSYKYTVAEFAALAAAAGFRQQAVWTDPAELFSVQYFTAVACRAPRSLT